MYFRKKKVFISYAREDIKFAEELRNFLIGHGHDVFKDIESLGPGEQWQKRTYAEMNKADVIIPVISDTSATKQGRIRFEFQQALDLQSTRKTLIIPVRVDGCSEMAGFGNFNIIDWSHQMQVKLLKALHPVSRRWKIISLVILGIIAALITANFVWLKIHPRETFKFTFSAAITDYKNQKPLAGVEAQLLNENGQVIAHSPLSRSNGEVKLSTTLPETREVIICFKRSGYAQRSENFELRNWMRQLRTVKKNIRIELIPMQRKCFQLAGGFNLTHDETQRIQDQTEFELSYNAPLVLKISFDNAAVVPYGANDKFIFTGSSVIIYANGKAVPTAVELSQITTPMSRGKLEERLQNNLSQTIRLERQNIITEIISVLEQQN
jgi:TIR domain